MNHKRGFVKVEKTDTEPLFCEKLYDLQNLHKRRKLYFYSLFIGYLHNMNYNYAKNSLDMNKKIQVQNEKV